MESHTDSKRIRLFRCGSGTFEVSTYHLEGAIASIHVAAPSFEKTDWQAIYHLYELLYQLQPNPVVAMNKAIASAYAVSKQKALEELRQIKGLEHHHLLCYSRQNVFLTWTRKKMRKLPLKKP